MKVKDVIYQRKAIRNYSSRPIESEGIKKVREILSSLTPLYKDIDLKAELVEEREKIQGIIKGIIGNYGKVHAPHYIVAMAKDKEGYRENVGFAMEEVVLKLTELGFGTCWIGAKIPKDLIRNIISMEDGYIPVILIALGYPEDTNYFNLELSSAHKRKPLEEMVEGHLDAAWEEIFNGVRRAPSGVNLQPWKFFKEDNKVHCYIKEGIITKKIANYGELDMGIALCHLKLMSKSMGLNISFKKETQLSIRKNLKYILTVEISEI